jgi:hypothetical protein
VSPLSMLSAMRWPNFTQPQVALGKRRLPSSSRMPRRAPRVARRDTSNIVRRPHPRQATIEESQQANDVMLLYMNDINLIRNSHS